MVRNTKQKIKKLRRKGAWPRSRDLLLDIGKFGSSSYLWTGRSYKCQILQSDQR